MNDLKNNNNPDLFINWAGVPQGQSTSLPPEHREKLRRNANNMLSRGQYLTLWEMLRDGLLDPVDEPDEDGLTLFQRVLNETVMGNAFVIHPSSDLVLQDARVRRKRRLSKKSSLPAGPWPALAMEAELANEVFGGRDMASIDVLSCRVQLLLTILIARGANPWKPWRKAALKAAVARSPENMVSDDPRGKSLSLLMTIRANGLIEALLDHPEAPSMDVLTTWRFIPSALHKQMNLAKTSQKAKAKQVEQIKAHQRDLLTWAVEADADNLTSVLMERGFSPMSNAIESKTLSSTTPSSATALSETAPSYGTSPDNDSLDSTPHPLLLALCGSVKRTDNGALFGDLLRHGVPWPRGMALDRLWKKWMADKSPVDFVQKDLSTLVEGLKTELSMTEDALRQSTAPLLARLLREAGGRNISLGNQWRSAMKKYYREMKLPSNFVCHMPGVGELSLQAMAIVNTPLSFSSKRPLEPMSSAKGLATPWDGNHGVTSACSDAQLAVLMRRSEWINEETLLLSENGKRKDSRLVVRDLVRAARSLLDSDLNCFEGRVMARAGVHFIMRCFLEFRPFAKTENLVYADVPTRSSVDAFVRPNPKDKDWWNDAFGRWNTASEDDSSHSAMANELLDAVRQAGWAAMRVSAAEIASSPLGMRFERCCGLLGIPEGLEYATSSQGIFRNVCVLRHVVDTLRCWCENDTERKWKTVTPSWAAVMVSGGKRIDPAEVARLDDALSSLAQQAPFDDNQEDVRQNVQDMRRAMSVFDHYADDNEMEDALQATGRPRRPRCWKVMMSWAEKQELRQFAKQVQQEGGSAAKGERLGKGNGGEAGKSAAKAVKRSGRPRL